MYLLQVVASATEALYVHLLRKRYDYYLLLLGIALTVLAILFIPAFGFPKGTVITIPEHASFRDTATELAEADLIGNPLVFRALARLTFMDNDVRSGRYLFVEPQGMAVVLWRLANGISGIPSVRVTFPEGITVREMGALLKTALPAFNDASFITLATPYEGYLFPDTYNFYADTAPEEVIARMRDRFAEVAVPLVEKSSTNESLLRVITMASILEKETKVGPDRAVVSGILWSRIEEGMPLQVDAVFGYIKGIPTYHPSGADLEIDSPYNTYEYRDLPPGPIGNPGADAITAALTPTPSPYTYYLTGTDGNMYYARTFEEHKQNKEQYLR